MRCLDLSLYSERWVQGLHDNTAKGVLAFLNKLEDDAATKALEKSEPYKFIPSRGQVRGTVFHAKGSMVL